MRKQRRVVMRSPREEFHKGSDEGSDGRVAEDWDGEDGRPARGRDSVVVPPRSPLPDVVPAPRARRDEYASEEQEEPRRRFRPVRALLSLIILVIIALAIYWAYQQPFGKRAAEEIVKMAEAVLRAAKNAIKSLIDR